MKKARIVLSVVLVMALAAGIFAFKSKKYMAQVFYTCNTYYATCGMTWAIGAFMTTIWSPADIYTFTEANSNPAVFNQNCWNNCTWSNTVYMEAGF